jgi:hypothetical protein
MTRIVGPLAALLLPLSVSFGAAAMIGGNDGQPEAKHAPAKLAACEISVDQRADSIVLEGLVSAGRAVSGSYRLEVWQDGAGSSAISQSGDFGVAAGTSASLGVVSLSKSAGGYGAKLNVRFDDGGADCKDTAPKSPKQKLLEQKNPVPGATSGRKAAGSAEVQPPHATLDPKSATSK